jgi:hypothetical protein
MRLSITDNPLFIAGMLVVLSCALLIVNHELHLLGHIAALFGKNVEGQAPVVYVHCNAGPSQWC